MTIFFSSFKIEVYFLICLSVVSISISRISVVSTISMSVVSIIPRFGISFSLSFTFLSGFNSGGFFGSGRGSGKKGESVVTTQMTICIRIPDMMSGIDYGSSSFNVNFNFAGGDCSIFVGNSVSVGNSSVKKGCSISVAKTKTIAKMGNNSRCSMSSCKNGGVSLTLLAAVVSVSVSWISIVSTIISTIISTIT